MLFFILFHQSATRMAAVITNFSALHLHKHAKACWGEETVKKTMEASNASEAREVLSKSKDGSIAAAFQFKGKGNISYSHRQHTRTETR